MFVQSTNQPLSILLYIVCMIKTRTFEWVRFDRKSYPTLLELELLVEMTETKQDKTYAIGFVLIHDRNPYVCFPYCYWQLASETGREKMEYHIHQRIPCHMTCPDSTIVHYIVMEMVIVFNIKSHLNLILLRVVLGEPPNFDKQTNSPALRGSWNNKIPGI